MGDSLLVTIGLMLLSGIGSMLVAMAVLWAWNRSPRMMRAVTVVLLALAAAVPLYVYAAAWEATWGKFGWMPTIRADQRSWSIHGLVATAWIHMMAGASGSSLILLAARARLPQGCLQAAVIDGSAWTRWWRIELPLLWPAIVLAAGWSALLAATEMTVADLYAVRTLADVVYQQFAIAPATVPAVTLLLLVVLTTAALAGMARLFSPSVMPRWSMPSRPTNASNAAQTWSVLGVICGLSTLTLLLGVPLASLWIKAGWMVDRAGEQWTARFSHGQALATVVDAVTRFGVELQWSMMLAIVVIGLVLPLSYGLVMLGQRWRAARALIFLGLLGVALVPGPLVALATIWLFDRDWPPGLAWLYDQTLLPAALAASGRPLLLSVALLCATLESFPVGLIDSQRLERPNRWQRFRRVWLPWFLPTFLVVGLLQWILAWGDLTASLLVAPPGVQTVAARMFGLLHSGVRGQEAGLCLVVLALEVPVMAIIWFILVRHRRRGAI